MPVKCSVADVYPRSGVKMIPDPGRIRVRVKEFKYLNPKIVSKLSEI